MRTGRGFERLVNFADAVVAIALTLLVLPLVDIPADLRRDTGLGEIWTEYRAQFLAFLVSFLVIWNIWRSHHRTLELFRGYDRWLMSLQMLWLLTIVTLPFTTELLSSPMDERISVPFYLANLTISSAALSAMELHGRRHPELLHADSPEVASWLRDRATWFTPVIIVLALVLSFFVPTAALWSLLLLTIDGVVERWWVHRRVPRT